MNATITAAQRTAYLAELPTATAERLHELATLGDPRLNAAIRVAPNAYADLVAWIDQARAKRSSRRWMDWTVIGAVAASVAAAGVILGPGLGAPAAPAAVIAQPTPTPERTPKPTVSPTPKPKPTTTPTAKPTSTPQPGATAPAQPVEAPAGDGGTGGGSSGGGGAAGPAPVSPEPPAPVVPDPPAPYDPCAAGPSFECNGNATYTQGPNFVDHATCDALGGPTILLLPHNVGWGGTSIDGGEMSATPHTAYVDGDTVNWYACGW